MGTTYKNDNNQLFVGRFLTLIKVYLVIPTYKKPGIQNPVGRLWYSDTKNHRKPTYKKLITLILVGCL